MSIRIDEPSIPDHILYKISRLNALMDTAKTLYDEILDWYDRELKSYDPTADPESELFDPGIGCSISAISSAEILNALSVVQTANEVYLDEITPPDE